MATKGTGIAVTTQFILRCWETDLGAVTTFDEALRALSEHIQLRCKHGARSWLQPENINWIQVPLQRVKGDDVHTWYIARSHNGIRDEWLGHSVRWPPPPAPTPAPRIDVYEGMNLFMP